MMRAGSFNEEIPFEQMYAEEKAARSAKASNASEPHATEWSMRIA